MKCKRILSVSLAAALLLMNAPSSALAAENIKPQQAEEASVSRVLPKEDFEAAEPAAKAVPVSGAAAEFTPSSADPYTLTADDVNLAQCREDDGDSNTPFIDAVMITGYKDIDLSDDRYTNIVIPETLPFEKPVLDDDGREKKDDEGKVITETVVMPVIKAYRLNHANLEKLTVSKNLVYLDSFEGCSKLSEIVIPDDSQLENFGTKTFAGTAVTQINIPSKIEKIEGGMFAGCKNLETVTFAADTKITEIGGSAFRETGLKSIELPETCAYIGEYAFQSTSLEEVTFPDALTEIGTGAFLHCLSLSKVTFGSNLMTIGDSAFNHTALEEVVIPDSVTFIGREAFSDIEALRSITIGSGLKNLGGIARLGDLDAASRFQNDVNVETIVLNEGLEKIGDSMFSWCRKVKEIVIPSTVKHIGSHAFGSNDASSPNALRTVTFAEGSQLENIFESGFGFCAIKHLKLPVAPKPFKIWDSAFEANHALLDVDLGNCCQIGSGTFYSSEDYYLTDGAGGGAFAYCTSLSSVNFEEDEDLEIINHGAFNGCAELLGPIVLPPKVKKLGSECFHGCKSLTDFTFNDGLEVIWGGAFMEADLHAIILPDSVKSVGSRCFEGNLHVGEIKLSSSMTVIPTRFLDCYAEDVAAWNAAHGSTTDVGKHGQLKKLVIPDNIKEIGIDAFDGCLDLEYLDLGKVEYIGQGAFSIPDLLIGMTGETDNLKTVVMSPALKEIGTTPPHCDAWEASTPYVFNNHGDFDGLVLPPTLEKVGPYALGKCPALKELTMTENLQFVGSHAFEFCPNLTKVVFADSADTQFEDEVFRGCTGITEVSLPAWLETVPKGIFTDCSNLATVNWSEGMRKIGGNAFCGTALSSITLPESCVNIDSGAFQNAPVMEANFGSKMQVIQDNAFVQDTYLHLMPYVYIPDSVQSIGERAFGYYKNSAKSYAEIAKEVEGTDANISEMLGPTIANTDFILYGGQAAERYANENGMIYGGTDPSVYVPVDTKVKFEPDENIEWTPEKEDGLTLTVLNAREAYPDKVLVNGEELEREYYLNNVTEETKQIILTPEYLRSLKSGTYTVSAEYPNGAAVAEITVNNGEKPADTDNKNSDTESSDTTDSAKDSDVTDSDKKTTDSDNKDTSDTPDLPGTPDIPEARMLGDVNNDGKISAKDSIMVQRYVIKLTALDDKQLKTADVSGDNKVTTKDALDILRFTIKLSKNENIGKPIV